LNIKNKITFTKINIIDVHAKFALEWQPLIGVNTLVHELPTQQKMTTSHFGIFFSHSHHLQIARLLCLWVDIHVDLMFVVILIVDEWDRWG
jgi:hypothetical protein